MLVDDQFGGMRANDVKGLREFERVNTRLKRIVANRQPAPYQEGRMFP